MRKLGEVQVTRRRVQGGRIYTVGGKWIHAPITRSPCAVPSLLHQLSLYVIFTVVVHLASYWIFYITSRYLAAVHGRWAGEPRAARQVPVEMGVGVEVVVRASKRLNAKNFQMRACDVRVSGSRGLERLVFIISRLHVSST